MYPDFQSYRVDRIFRLIVDKVLARYMSLVSQT